MSILNKFGKRHIQLASLWAGSAAVYGAASGVAICYMTDWKVVLRYLPYYNGKFTEE